MTIIQAFVDFLRDKGYGIPGQNIYLYRVPNSLKTEPELLWVIPSGGVPIRKNRTGELIKAYNFNIFYRSRSAEKVNKVMSDLENMINCSNCVKLKDFELVDISTTQMNVSQDLDSEDRMVGNLSVQLEVYKGCN